MLKLNAGFSRKVGEANYGSRGASVNVELEVESNLISDPDALMSRIRNLFTIARQAVDGELNGSRVDAGEQPQDQNDRPRGNSSDRVRYATTSQVRAIRAICDRQDIDALKLASERFRVNDLEELTLREASSLIDELKGTSNSGRKAGAR